MFSELIDDVVRRTGRPDRIPDIQNWVNSTIRECQVQALFYKDFVEDELSTTSDPLIWTFPTGYRILTVAEYPYCRFPDFVRPSRLQRDKADYFYASQNYMVFNGCGRDTSQVIKVGYYTLSKRLKYYPVGSRPAVYDEEAEIWTYNPPITDPDAQAAAQAAVSNWLLLTHNMVIQEGTVSKVFKDMKDVDRSSTSYSLYMQLKQTILATEALEFLPTGSTGGQ